MDYAAIVHQIQEQVRQKGATPAEASEAFGPAREEHLRYLTDLHGSYGSYSEFYREDELEDLKRIAVPENVVDFYRQYEPQWLPTLSGGVRLLGLEAIYDENSSGAPGAFLIRFGVLVFATTIGGHAICMDLNRLTDGQPRVIIVDYTFCTYNDALRVVECVPMLPPEVIAEYKQDGVILLSPEIIARSAPEIAGTFGEFLTRLANNDLPDVERLL